MEYRLEDLSGLVVWYITSNQASRKKGEGDTMAGKPQAEKAVERFPELGCFAVAVRRIVYEKGMTLDNAIKKSGISKSAWFAGMAGSGGKPTRLPSLASFFAIADGLGITPEELIAAMRKEAGVREKSNGERAENDE